MIPKVIKNYNLFLDGIGLAGLCSSVRLPDLTIQTDQHRAGGMDGPVPLDLGMEGIGIGFSLAEHHPAVFRQFGLLNQNAVQVTFRAAKVDDTVTERYIIKARGMYTAVQLGEVSNGQKNPLGGQIGCRYFKVEMNGQELFEIDFDNMIRRVNGVDQLRQMREAIGL